MNAARAFVEAMGELGNYYHRQYNEGNRDVVATLTIEEENLLHARHLGRTHGWWDNVTGTMQGLHALYYHTGRRAEWARLVNEIVPDFVDLTTDGPISGREDNWSLVTQYRVHLAEEAQNWNEAERLQRLRTDRSRKKFALALAMPPEKLDDVRRNYIHSLGSSLHELAEIQRQLRLPECTASYEEALKLAESIDDKTHAAICAFNLGNAYSVIPTIRDLSKAENLYLRGLGLLDKRDLLGQAQCLGQLGHVAYERFKEARERKKPKEKLLSHLNKALQFYQQALEMIPPNAVGNLAVVHNELGNIYYSAGDIGNALPHYRRSIRYEEMQSNLYGAAQTCDNVALALALAGRFADALDFAHTALRNYETYGDRAAKEIQKTRELIAKIQQDIKTDGGTE